MWYFSQPQNLKIMILSFFFHNLKIFSNIQDFKIFYNMKFQLETPTAAKGSVAEVGTQGKLTMLNVSISIDFYGFHWFLLIFIDFYGFSMILSGFSVIFSGLQGDN